ncbi:MAG: hypothetical protein JXB00_11215 [Bacteroidales bacterium]|nr:hypothetical protein [Bacteroidales bacterium]
MRLNRKVCRSYFSKQVLLLSVIMVTRFLFEVSVVLAQPANGHLFRVVELRVDSLVYQSGIHTVKVNNENRLCFTFDNNDEVCEVRLYPEPHMKNKRINLLPSGDFDVIDSLLFINNQYYRFKVRFKNLTKSQFLRFTFTINDDGVQKIEEVNLQPCTNTTVNLYPSSNELFIGEEKEFELVCNNVENLRYSTEWTSGKGIDYRIAERSGRLFLYLLPARNGEIQMAIDLQTHKPRLENNNKLTYQLAPINYNFVVKNSRLQFLTVDRKEFTLEETTRMEGIEVQIDNSRLLAMNKTYRIENQEKAGGALIAELFTKSSMANNRVLCLMRVFNYHRNADGYLYIKDGDEAKFITNFSVTPKTRIEKISILREGKDWVQNLSVYPGETIDLKVEGEGLHKARLHFEDLVDVGSDTLIRNENEQIFKLKVPLQISKKQVNIYNFSKPTGQYLNVREYQEPRPFDFVFVNYGDLNRVVSNIKGPVLYDKTVKDVVLSFNNDKIDSDDKLYGKQYLKLDIQVTGMKNELIEMRSIDNITVCPSDRSPRYSFYGTKDCWNDELSLNKYIRKSTYDLDEWSRIKLTLQHNPSKYGNEGMKKEVEIVLKKYYKFDIDVSFPAGLITVYKTDQENEETGETERVTEFGNLWGVSMAMIAQFSFYHPDKIAKLRPYKVGAGFIALNAFNLSSTETNQDLAFVLLGSLYPTSKDSKLSFPLYIGGGYKILDRSWMFLFGPGIRVRL